MKKGCKSSGGRKITKKEILCELEEAQKDKEYMKEVDKMISLTSRAIKIKTH